MSAGQKLRRRINALLRQHGRDAGVDLVFDERESWLIDLAVELEDRRVQLQARLDAELDAGAGAATLNGLSAEIRRTIHSITDLLDKVDFGDRAQPVRRPGRPGAQPARFG